MSSPMDRPQHLAQSFNLALQRTSLAHYIPLSKDPEQGGNIPPVAGGAEGDWNMVQFQNLAPLDTLLNEGLSPYAAVPGIQQRDNLQLDTIVGHAQGYIGELLLAL